MSDFSVEKIGKLIVVNCAADLIDENVVIVHNLLAKHTVEMDAESAIVLDLKNKFQWNNFFLREVAAIAVHLKKHKQKLCAVNVPRESAKILADLGMDSAILIFQNLDDIVGSAPPQVKLDANFLNPFIAGAMQTLKVQCNTEVAPGKLTAKTNMNSHPVEIAAVLGIVSPTFNGSIAICFPKQTFLELMSNMLMEKCTEITKELEDGAGELLNIIFGHAKRELNEKGYGIEKAIPTIVRGRGIEVKHVTPSPTIILPFDSSAGKFHIEIGLDAASLT